MARATHENSYAKTILYNSTNLSLLYTNSRGASILAEMIEEPTTPA